MSTIALLRISPLPANPAMIQRHVTPSYNIHMPLRLTPASILKPFSALDNPRFRRTSISMCYRATVPATERLLAALSYTIPSLNSLHYGYFLLARFPALGLTIEPLLPFISAFRSIPCASFVAFFALYVGVVRNPALGRFVRFNAMQAVVLDVMLSVPALLQRIFGVPVKGLGFRLLEIGYDVVFVVAAGCCLYGFVSCVLGRTPCLPIVASAADRQL